MLKYAFVLLLILPTIVIGVSLLEPIEKEVGDESVLLGAVAPGQTLELKFSRDTGVLAAINPATKKNALWDQASVVKLTLPEGWTSKDSLKYENPLTVYVTVSPTAEKRQYTFSVVFLDEYEGTPTAVTRFKVDVDPDVVELSLDKPTVTAGVGQPALFLLRAKSRSIASDTFVIKATGLPYDWQFKKTFFLPHEGEQEVFFEVVGNIQKEVSFSINVTSLSSPAVVKKLDAKVVTTSDLLQDAKSASLGLPLFPSVEQHVYSLFGLVSNLLFK